MKKSIILLSFSLLILACGQKEGESAQKKFSSTNLEELQKEKASYTSQIKNLTQDLEKINTAIEKLTGGEKRTLVTALKAEAQVFNHIIEVQANIKTRQNLQLVPEFGGRLEQILVLEGQDVK